MGGAFARKGLSIAIGLNKWWGAEGYIRALTGGTDRMKQDTSQAGVGDADEEAWNIGSLRTELTIWWNKTRHWRDRVRRSGRLKPYLHGE
jgi:hypothetical protein